MSLSTVVNKDASKTCQPQTVEEQVSTMRIKSDKNPLRCQNTSCSKQRRRRRSWMLLLLIFHGEILSSMSLLPSNPAGSTSFMSPASPSFDNRNVQIVLVRRPVGGKFGYGRTRSFRLSSQPDKKNDEGKTSSSDDSGNFWNRISSSFSNGDDDSKKREKKEEKKRKKEERKKQRNKASNAESVLQDVVRRFRDSRDSKKLEKERELTKKLEKEIDDDKRGMSNILNTSYISSAIEGVANQMKKSTTDDADANNRAPKEREPELDPFQKRKLEVEARRIRERQLAEEKYQQRLERQAEITRQRRELSEQRAKAIEEDRIRQDEKRKEQERLRVEALQRAKEREEQLKLEQQKKRVELQRQSEKRREELRKQREKLEEEEAKLRARRERDASIRAVAKLASPSTAVDAGGNSSDGSSNVQGKQEEQAGASANTNKQSPTNRAKDTSSRNRRDTTGDKKKKQEKDKEIKANKKGNETDDGDKESNSNPWSKLVASVLEGKKRDEEWVPVARKWAIAPGEIKPIEAAGLDLLLVASKDGAKLHCVANSCPHLGTPLELAMLERRPIESSSSSDPTKQDGGGGIVVPDMLEETLIANLLAQDGCEDCIVCPLHHTAFALESGEVRGEWCPYPPVIGKMMGTVKTKEKLPVFDTRVKGKDIQVRLNTPVK